MKRRDKAVAGCEDCASEKEQRAADKALANRIHKSLGPLINMPNFWAGAKQEVTAKIRAAIRAERKGR